MNPTQAITLTRLVRGACPSQKIDEYTPDLWYEMLNDLNFDDARTAIIELGRHQTFISPAEIRSHIQTIRNDRIRTAYIDIPAADADPDDIRLWLDTVRAENTRIANGEPPPPQPIHPKRNIPSLLTNTLDRLPRMPGETP